MREKRFHYVYIVTNGINNRYYIGKHSTSNMNDGYMGSGLAIKQAIFKHGVENFNKDILSFFESEDAAYLFEKEAISSCIGDRRCYNINMDARGVTSDNHPLNKPVYQFGMGGKLIKKHSSVRQAGRDVGVDSSSISYAALGKYNHSGGYRWGFFNTPNDINKRRKGGRFGKRTFEERLDTSAALGSPIRMVDPKTGLTVKLFKSMLHVTSEMKVTKYAIWNVIRGRSKTSCGYAWEYVKKGV
jgi:hypothetical protein